MTFLKLFFALILAWNVSYASSLAVYQDKTLYQFTAENNYIGFTQGVSAKCEGVSMGISVMTSCPPEERLCKEFIHMKKAERKVQDTLENIKALTQLISLPKPTSFDAASAIESARLLAKEQSALASRELAFSQESLRLENIFKKQTSDKQARQSIKMCKKEIELSLRRGLVQFSTAYEANIKDKEITVIQNLSIVNRSGIDIKADTAMFYYRRASQYVNPIHFYPWVARKHKERPKRVSKNYKAMAKSDIMGGDIAPVEPLVSYENAREYKITNLTLPSTGLALEAQVLTWKAALSCEIRAYPYVDTQAFEVCSFEPKYQIDANRWKVKTDGKMLNENATGEYHKKTYTIYTQKEKDIKIQRKPIVKKERETGIFGGTARKKDGYTLSLINKSDKVKTLTLIERIPSSSTEEIKVKLLSVGPKVNYKVLKNGEIEMKISLKANEMKKIEVLFEIAYDKDIKVNY
ncbi:MAG: hypothetical protein DRQ78_01555 [Epsilonproteobacteria bacterium]|nr:MAG: hypothetical protein DRQ78_01555 [Campylobacterota bacterium]